MICPAGPVAVATAISVGLISPPVAACVASIAAWVNPAVPAAPASVVALPAGVKASKPPTARGISPIEKPGGITYSFWSTDDFKM
jgi:hypothetical protein